MMRGFSIIAAAIGLAIVSASAFAQSSPTAGALDENHHPRFDEIETSLSELLERLDILSARIRQLEENESRLIETVNALVKDSSRTPVPAGDRRDGGSVVPTSVALNAISPNLVDGETLATDYQKALLLQAEGRYDEAARGFERVYEAEPDGDLADNAMFWLGEMRFVGKDYQSAIKIFERVLADYPDGNRAPDSLYRVGLCYSALGDLMMAARVFDRVVASYPYSTAAASARAQLERIRY